jgi:hypothetical protein
MKQEDIDKRFPHKEGFHYIARSKKDGKEFNDYTNKSGALTRYLVDKEKMKIPSCFLRDKYFREHGELWHEKWFDIISLKNEEIETETCPYCGWETKKGKYTFDSMMTHMKKIHKKGYDELISDFPEYKKFQYVRKCLNVKYYDNADEYVICQVCGKKVMFVSASHLSKHGMTKEEYLLKYGKDNYISNKYKDSLREKMVEINKTLKPNFISKAEIEIGEYVESLGFEIERSNRKILGGKELDIVVPSKNFAIEYNGLYYHCEWNGMTKFYHRDKVFDCKNKGYKLVHVFEDDFIHHKDIIFKRIHDILLGEEEKEIDLTKLSVSPISEEDFIDFYKKHSLYDYKPSQTHFGAFYDGLLCFVCSCTTDNRNSLKTQINGFCGDFTLSEGICLKSCIDKIVEEINPSEICCDLDIAWNVDEDDNVLTRLGFKMKENVDPECMWYYDEICRDKRISIDLGDEFRFWNSGFSRYSMPLPH